jgi:glutamine amidotransferase-like uncharacterized protein
MKCIPLCAWLSLLIISILILGLGCTPPSQGPGRHEIKTDFAILSPDGSRAVWSKEVKALEEFVTLFGWTYRELSFKDINSGALSGGFRAYLSPGGFTPLRMDRITQEGDDSIISYVEKGGAYVGFCTGAFEASETKIWAETGGKCHLKGDYETYEFTTRLPLFPGEALGPLSWVPYRVSPTSLESVVMDQAPSVIRNRRTKLIYRGGPFFRPTREPRNYRVWARAQKPSWAPAAASMGANMPTIISFERGDGRVILFSYHPVFLLKGIIGGRRIQKEVLTPIARCDPTPYTADEVNLESWNILHAALQTALKIPVTEVTRDDLLRRKTHQKP